MLRTSGYTIYVPLPDHPGETLLVHGYTGAYDRVATEVTEFLRSRESSSPRPLYGAWSDEPVRGDAAAPGDETLALLARRGYLTPMSPEQEERFFARLVDGLHERALQRPPSYLFIPSYDCNLRCSYCFQDHMRTDCSFRHLLNTMRPAIVERIVSALPEIEALHGVAAGEPVRRNVGFFGGEPLLAAHRRIVEQIMAGVRDIGAADFWAVTNGTEIDAYADLLGPEGIARLQITLDGPPAEHDRRRIYPDGSGSFERIAAGISLALGRGAEVSARINVDRGNLGDLPAVAAAIAERGWDRASGFSAYAVPIRASNDKTEARSTLSSAELDRSLRAMAAEHPEVAMLSRPDEGLRAWARRIFDGGESPRPNLRPAFCGAHDRMYIFDPFADVYACWERTGDPGVRIGRIAPGGRVEMAVDVAAAWRGRTVASNPVCRRCRYALHCGGGCAVLALTHSGRFNANYCDGFAARFRSSVAEAYRAHLDGARPSSTSSRACDL